MRHLKLAFLSLALFFVFLFVAFAVGDYNQAAYFLRIESALSWMTRATGSLVACVSLILMMSRAVAGDSLRRQAGFIVPLLGGALLISGTWAATLSLGAIVVVLVLRGPRTASSTDSADAPTDDPDLPKWIQGS